MLNARPSPLLKFVGLSAVGFAQLLSSGSASADLVRVFAAGGLTSQTPDAGSTLSSKELVGVQGKLAAHFDVFGPIPGVTIYAGPELHVGTSVREYDSASVKNKEIVKSNNAGLEAGVHVGLIPIVTLQGGLNYVFPMGGSKEVTKGLAAAETGKASKGSEVGATLRALITPFPLTRLGVEYSLGTGAMTYEKHGEMKYSYSAVRAVFGISL